MLFFISPKNGSIYSERVCKNALEKYIFSDFSFTVHQMEKIQILIFQQISKKLHKKNLETKIYIQELLFCQVKISLHSKL